MFPNLHVLQLNIDFILCCKYCFKLMSTTCNYLIQKENDKNSSDILFSFKTPSLVQFGIF